MAEWIRSECRLYAYVHERGWLLRRERDKEKEAVIKSIREHYRGQTEEAIQAIIKRDVKLARISDEYVVYVAPGKGALKSFEEATAFAKYVHKLASPPDRFCDAVFVGGERGAGGREAAKANPFERAVPGRNPTLPKKESVATEMPKAELQFLDNLNAGQPYSLIHKTKKPVTLVVQTFGTKNGVGQLVTPGQVVQATGRSDGEMLERAAQQANELAKMLREMKPAFDAYVLHTRYESYVCIGEYDSKDDAKLLATAEAITKLPLKDKKTGEYLKLFMEKPLPAAIPRP